jgi:hypothetical protein
VRLKEAGGKSVGRRTGMPRTRKGRGQADLRRAKAGASLQHKTKPYIRHMAKFRISDSPRRTESSRCLPRETCRVSEVGTAENITGL